MSDTLQILPKQLDATQRNDFLNNSETHGAHEVVRDGQPISLDPLDSLMTEMRNRVDDKEWQDRAQSDRWLAPRVHFALRLSRAEAAERGLWQWIALRYSWYVEWRWTNLEGAITDNHWWGPIHKQSFARLWWGAEIFRDGADYTPVERAFVFQDLPNSYLHRPIVRCRSLALSVIDKLSQSEAPSSDQVNDLARVLNLATVGTPPEVETHYQADDFSAYEAWVRTPPAEAASWDSLPDGPPTIDTTVASKEGGAQIVSRGWQYAKLG